MTDNVYSIRILVAIFDYVIGKCILDYIEDKDEPNFLSYEFFKNFILSVFRKYVTSGRNNIDHKVYDQKYVL